jgi:uncharacterized delta-60 repeat protein
VGIKNDIRLAVLIGLSVLAGTTSAISTSGQLDTTFHSPLGYAVVDGAASGPCTVSVEEKRDGKKVVMGCVTEGTRTSILVAQFHKTGQLDSSFGEGGIARHDDPDGRNVESFGLAVQTDGKVVVTGRRHNGSDWDVLLWRLDRRGKSDKLFGVGGRVIYHGPGGGDDAGRAVADGLNGKVIVAGETYNGRNYDVLLLRYTSRGDLDKTFGAGGVVTYNGEGDGDDRPVGVLHRVTRGYEYSDLEYKTTIIQRTTVIATTALPGKTGASALLLRFAGNGKPDPFFGNNGIVTYSGSDDEPILSLGGQLRSDGSIVVLATTGKIGNSGIMIFRYSYDGKLDKTFGTQGIVTYDPPSGGSASATSIDVQKDLKLVVAGTFSDGSGTSSLVLRLNYNGTLDANFGIGGAATFAFPGAIDNAATSAALQQDGKILVGGYGSDGDTRDLFIFRLLK